uniref:DUF7086 domain-containing protein n=1 Tax=Oryza glumipatula TaxID=40148 RepID=A0A0D9ZH74_9ORYZ
MIEKKPINYLFLLLGEMLGLFSLDQLNFLCAHTNRHRIGAKDSMLYSTYLERYNQFIPGTLPSWLKLSLGPVFYESWWTSTPPPPALW